MKVTHTGFEIRTALITVDNPDAFLRRLRGTMRKNVTTIICFNAGNMAGVRHAEAALTHAIRSFSEGSPIAKTLEMESLLYAAGTHQCTDAAILGIHKGRNRAYVCCYPENQDIWPELKSFIHFIDWEEVAPGPEKVARLRRLFSISDDELAAAGGECRLQDLIIERVALLEAYH